MNEFIAKQPVAGTLMCSPGALEVQRGCDEYAAYVGLDVHKDTIVIALARRGRTAAEHWGEIGHKAKSVAKLVARVMATFGGERVLWCYEAGPCGYGLYRQLLALGQDCQVVAPSQIPRKPGERVKTDRRDARKLATHLRSGELTAVWVPGEEQEAMRDLTRARGDFKAQERKARQQLNAFVLRHDHHWPSHRSRWTRAHLEWLESLEFAHPWQREVICRYLEAVREASRRVAEITAEMERALPQWSLAPVIHSLVALRGIDKVAAMTVLAELGDLSRFDSPRQLMGFLGLVPSEHSSGSRRRQGAITLTGNRHARRMLVESAWSYRFPARQTAHLQRKAASASAEARTIAWQAQKRLCGRYRRLQQAGKNTKQVTVAIARELVGFLWAIVCQEMPKVHAQARS